MMTDDLPPHDLPLSGLTCVCMAANVPGPAAAAILAGQGMTVIKIEPPSGDLTAHEMPAWYADLNRAARIETVDLRSDAGQARFRDLMAVADVLISSHRRAALERLGITVTALAGLKPRLCWVEIVGDVDAPDVPGHDLTYQAAAGLLGDRMPRSLIADMAGAEAAAGAAVTLLLGRERGRTGRHVAVGLRQAAERFAAPVRQGVTVNGGLLSGARPEYAIHRTADGLVACAALEPHFAARLAEVAGDDVAGFFAGLTASDCRALAIAHDFPLEPFSA